MLRGWGEENQLDLSLMYRLCGVIYESCSLCCLLQHCCLWNLYWNSWCMFVKKPHTLASRKSKFELHCFHMQRLFITFNFCYKLHWLQVCKIVSGCCHKCEEFIVAVLFMSWMTLAIFLFFFLLFSRFTKKDLQAACIHTPTINTAVLLSHVMFRFL